MLRMLVALASVVSAGLVEAQTRDDLAAAVAAVEASAPAALVRHGVPGVAVAMVIDGEPVWAGGFGVADVETGARVTADSVFEIASVTKPVTAWAMLRLAEEGRIDLDAPIETYLGGWTLPPSEFDHSGVTGRSILAHGAGLGAGGDSGGPPAASVPTLVEAANGAGMEYGPIRVTHPPGEAYHYSSKGFVLLEMAVETITGEPFALYVTREVLDPLGMTDSSFGWTPGLEARAAWGHDWYGRRLPHYSHATKAQGGIVATATDVAKFLAASMSGPDGVEPGRGVISPGSVKATFTPFPFEADQSAVGLGYNLHLDGETLVARKSGDHRGYKAIVFSMPEIGAGLVILANSDRAAPGIFADIACPWSEALPGNPMRNVCGQLRTLRNAHWFAGGIAALIGLLISGRVVVDLRRRKRDGPRQSSALRRVFALLLLALLMGWWVYWYSDIPLRLQGFPPTFYTVRATLWPTAFVWVSLGLSALIAGVCLAVLSPRKPGQTRA
ncbi:serine hydrolase domain-containing protein [Mesorhizobium sp. KR9-304]|uniref:serine hydrolase domain-containing protein n=1 Tax=Mesorhizobium sp. KR9-304 TaxID=3156614 RepID=UPI0032B541CE